MNDITIRFLCVYEFLFLQKKVKSPSDFAKKIEISISLMNEILKKRTNAGIVPIQNLVNIFTEISAEFILTGKGEMLKNNESINEKIEKKEFSDNEREYLELLKKNLKEKELQLNECKNEVQSLKKYRIST